MHVFDTYIVQLTFIGDLKFVAQRIATQFAEEHWEQNVDVQSMQAVLSSPSFLEKIRSESELEMALLETMWAKTEEGIYVAARNTYEQRRAALQAESQAEFSILWKARVVLRAQLHSIGLDALEESPLKEQLREVLWAYVNQDLLQPVIKRAKSKGLIRTQSMQKTMAKLLDTLAQKEHRTSPLEALGKFNKKNGIDLPTAEEMETTKQGYLNDLTASMEKVTDGPRLFLGVVINLYATSHDGVLYATGKFAPRILKLLKPSLEAEKYARLEGIKDAVKAGKVDESIREEMRSMVKTTIVFEQYDGPN